MLLTLTLFGLMHMLSCSEPNLVLCRCSLDVNPIWFHADAHLLWTQFGFIRVLSCSKTQFGFMHVLSCSESNLVSCTYSLALNPIWFHAYALLLWTNLVPCMWFSLWPCLVSCRCYLALNPIWFDAGARLMWTQIGFMRMLTCSEPNLVSYGCSLTLNPTWFHAGALLRRTQFGCMQPLS